MTATFTPISNLSNLYANNLKLSWGSNTTLTIGAGACRDSANVIDMVVSSTLTLNAAVNGANGLDTGTFAASTWYYVYIVGDSSSYNAPASLLSLSATSPTLPSGYDSYRLIGQALSDGSTHFLLFYQVGNGNLRTYWWDVMPVVNAALTETSLTSISVAAGVPPLSNVSTYFWSAFTPNAAADEATFRITGSSATTPLFTISGVVAAKAQAMQFKFYTPVASGAAKIDYKVAASGSLALSVQGYESYI